MREVPKRGWKLRSTDILDEHQLDKNMVMSRENKEVEEKNEANLAYRIMYFGFTANVSIGRRLAYRRLILGSNR